jgi:itaconate CoA-transferase
MQNLPFSGLRVIALEQAVAAPLCSRQLCDLGADVVKIERPEGGDPARAYDGLLNGVSSYFAWLNRGKRSVVLDLRQPGDREKMGRLLDTADVFIHNLAPGSVEKQGFGYDELRARNPRIIWCGISGYGPNGPWRDKKAYDLLVQAESGVISVTGSPEEAAQVGVSIADIASGLYGYSAILASLYKRQSTGEGERIDISMLECLTEWMMPQLYFYERTGNVPPRVGTRHNMVLPYGSYSCADGSVMLAVLTERDWKRFCDMVMMKPDLTDDPRFVSNALRLANRVVLEEMIEARFRQYARGEVLSWLEAADIPTGTLNDVADVYNHPQLKSRERWVTVDSPGGEIQALLPPHNIHGVPARMGAVPAIGQHTLEVLEEIGGD